MFFRFPSHVDKLVVSSLNLLGLSLLHTPHHTAGAKYNNKSVRSLVLAVATRMGGGDGWVTRTVCEKKKKSAKAQSFSV